MSAHLQLPIPLGSETVVDDATIRALEQIWKPVKVAVRELGLSHDTICRLIESEDIEAYQAVRMGRDRRAANRRDKLGRRIGYKYMVRMADVWRIKYGEAWPRRVILEFGSRSAAA